MEHYFYLSDLICPSSPKCTGFVSFDPTVIETMTVTPSHENVQGVGVRARIEFNYTVELHQLRRCAPSVRIFDSPNCRQIHEILGDETKAIAKS